VGVLRVVFGGGVVAYVATARNTPSPTAPATPPAAAAATPPPRQPAED